MTIIELMLFRQSIWISIATLNIFICPFSLVDIGRFRRIRIDQIKFMLLLKVKSVGLAALLRM